VADRPISPVQVVLLAAAGALGAATLGTSSWALVNVQWALIGLPVAAAASSALAFRGRGIVAAAALAAGVAGAALLNTWSALYAVPAILAVLAAIVLLRRVSYLAVGAGLTVVFAFAAYGLDSAFAALRHRTLGEEVLAQGKAAAAQISAAADTQTASQLSNQIVGLYKSTVPVLPSVYFLTGTMLAVAVIAAVGWSARRVDEPVKIPPFDRVDLPPLIVLGAVVGLLGAGASRLTTVSPVWGTIGANLIACTSFLLLIQGLAVFSALLKRAHVGAPGRVAAYAVLLVIDAFLKLVTLTGLADMWLNFRKLPREGRPGLPLKPAPTSGDDRSAGV
jgi:uncharacterized protein YybS (DUF2232 family)